MGFRKQHETNHALTRLATDIEIAVSHGCVVPVVTVMTEKAFDRIWHKGVLYKMTKNKFSTALAIEYSQLKSRIRF